MSSEETLKSENNQYLILSGNGVTVTLENKFVVGLYLESDQDGKSVKMHPIEMGSANPVEMVAIIKTLQEKLLPKLLDQLRDSVTKDSKLSSSATTELIRTLFKGNISEDQ